MVSMIAYDYTTLLLWALLLTGIFLLILGIARHSIPLIVITSIMMFIACFYLFNLGQYKVFTSLDTIRELFHQFLNP